MRRAILHLLRCPSCRRGGLVPETEAAEIAFGPVRCLECQATFPVTEGVADLVLTRSRPSAAQRGMEEPLIARSYERYLRPALELWVSRQRLDAASEFLLYRSLLGQPQGPVLDLGTGTGLFARKLARDPQLPPVVGLDLSKAMLEEGMAQAREAGLRVDFIRAEAPALPFLDQSLGAVLQASSLHFMGDAETLMMEVGRVLRPGGRYVASTYQPPRGPAALLHRKAGLHPRGEDALRAAVAAAGLVGFERLAVPPFLVLKAERPL